MNAHEQKGDQGMTFEQIIEYVLENGHPFEHVEVDDGDIENGPGPVRVWYGVRLGELILHTDGVHGSLLESKRCDWIEGFGEGYPTVFHEIAWAGLPDQIVALAKDAEQHVEVV